MHMADALLSPAVAGTMYVFAAGAAAYSIHELKKEDISKKIPVMGVMGAFVFAAQMLNFTIPGTGSSGHICGGMLLTALLGPAAGFLTMIGILLVQCLLFADGGLLALGANIWNMAFYGCFLGSLLIWRPIMKKGASRKKIMLASVLGCILTLQLGAFSVVLETLLSNVTEMPFSVFTVSMQTIHLAIGLVEGLITAAVLIFIYEARPELLWGIDAAGEEKGRLSLRSTILILAAAALIIGGVLSIYASKNPDGLEWSLEQASVSVESDASDSAYETAGKVQEATALMPDYSVSGTDDAAGTSLSGVIGSAVVVAVCIGAAGLINLFRRKRNAKENN